MAIEKIVDEAVGDLRTVSVQGDGWKRVVVVIDSKDSIKIGYVNGDPTKLLLELTKPTT